MKLLLVSLLASSLLLQAECTIKRSSDIKIDFTAYKTPLKIGVGGTFNSVNVKKDIVEGSDIASLVKDAALEIDTKSVNSNNGTRDAKLVSFFFDKMVSTTIKAKVISTSGDDLNGHVVVNVSMNGVNREVPMSYIVKDKKFVASGVIDLADFNALDALSSINKACFDLHKGKTWQDVSLSFSFDLTKVCKR